MKTIVSLFHNKVFKFGLLFALFVTAALIAIAMILGKESGYFTIRVQNGDALKSIALALDPANEKEYTTGYDAKAIDDFDQTSPTYLFAEKNGKSFAAIDDLHNATPGDINLEKTYGYSFYIMNTTSNFQDVTVRLKLTMSKDDGLSDAIRVMTYYTSDGVQNFRVYQKTDTISTTYTAYSMIDSRNARKYFDDGDSTIFDTNTVNENIVISGNAGSNYVRYTILFWLEGDDPECNENILGKSARFQLEADVVS
ncbi:MAG: hypothetical protein IJM36_03530 [Acholeplasmatales bacterium]|nr:hypothetical protein [Acholeplasmatales bacterium]